MAEVEYANVSLRYPGNPVPAVSGLQLDIADGELLVLVGPSGCGKSTALRMLAGLEDVTDGAIRIGGKDVTDLSPKDRDIAMVFQNYALYPHKTVAENIGFALSIAKVDKTEIRERVAEVAAMLDLTEVLGRRPKALSGGQRQRVAMGRAIIRDPQVFLMDEPLSNLDAKLRAQTRTQIAGLQKRLGVTTVYVTHDQTEALTLGHRIAVMRTGHLQQLGTPRELLDSPVNEFVATFIGSPAMNIVDLPVSEDGSRIRFGTLELEVPAPFGAPATGATTVHLGVRPEDLDLVGADEPGLDVTVDLVEELGADGYLYGSAEVAGSTRPIVVRVDGRTHPHAGDVARVSPAPGRTHFFDATTGERLP